MPDPDLEAAPWIHNRWIIDPHGPNDIPFRPYDRENFKRPLVELIGNVAREKPHQIAVDDGRLQLTYAQVYAMACRLSHEIARAGVPPGAIGIMVNYDAMHLVAVLGCLAAGRPSLLLSPDSPPAYNSRIIEAAKLQAVIVNGREARDALDPDCPPVIAVEAALAVDDHDNAPAAWLGPEEPAFIVSTSGTTGIPKLVVSTQCRAQLRICDAIEAGHFHEGDRFLTLGSAITGAALTRSFVPLLIGGCLRIVDLTHVGLGDVLKAIRSSRVTVLRTTVSIMKSLAQLPDAQGDLASLRLVWVTGEAFLQKDLGRIRGVLPPDCRLGYALSMTETLVTRWHLPDKDEHDPVRVASGYLLPDIEALVLREDGHPCADGEVGELVVRSEGVASGEWDAGQMVAGRFASAPDQPRRRVFRTGDLVRICSDGVLVVHGRKDRMIKIRGHRVELPFIEAAICGVAGVADAVIVAKPMDNGYRLHGFVVPAKVSAGVDDLPARISEALKTALPVYMQPYDIRIMDALPISASGKVDSAALLQRVSADSTEDVIPAAATQRVVSRQARAWVADAWRVAFGADRNPTLGFDVAGGDSLQFMQIIFRLEQLSGVSLPLSDFDNAMSQQGMAAALDRLLSGSRETAVQEKTVFFIPGVGGDEPRLMQFRAGCEPEVPFSCLDYGEWPQWVEPGFKFDRLIERMVARIQDAAPTGPLILSGYSLGGQVALAVAENLSAAGREIERVLILDSGAFVRVKRVKHGRAAVAPPTTWREEFREWQAANRRGQGAFVLALMATRRLISPRGARLLRWLARYRRKILPGQIDFYLSFQLQRCLLLDMSADWRRSLAKIPRVAAPVTVFKVGELNDHDAKAWQHHSSDVTMIPVGGDHFTMFDPPHLTSLCSRFMTICGTKLALS